MLSCIGFKPTKLKWRKLWHRIMLPMHSRRHWVVSFSTDIRIPYWDTVPHHMWRTQTRPKIFFLFVLLQFFFYLFFPLSVRTYTLLPKKNITVTYMHTCMFHSLFCVRFAVPTTRTRGDIIGYTYTYNVQTSRNRL